MNFVYILYVNIIWKQRGKKVPGGKLGGEGLLSVPKNSYWPLSNLSSIVVDYIGCDCSMHGFKFRLHTHA